MAPQLADDGYIDNDGMTDIPLAAQAEAIAGCQPRIAVPEHIRREESTGGAHKCSERSIVCRRRIRERWIRLIAAGAAEAGWLVGR